MAMSARGNTRSRSTAPAANPARSKWPAAYIWGISAVSPPIKAQPAWRQPWAMPATTAAASDGSSLPVAK